MRISGLDSGSVARVLAATDWLASVEAPALGWGDRKSIFLKLKPGVTGLGGDTSTTFSGVTGALGRAWDWLLVSNMNGS